MGFISSVIINSNLCLFWPYKIASSIYLVVTLYSHLLIINNSKGQDFSAFFGEGGEGGTEQRHHEIINVIVYNGAYVHTHSVCACVCVCVCVFV